jgi:hydrogenase expression/formation protein HypC
MCLAIPMRIDAVHGYTARCEAKGVWRDVSLFMLQHELPGAGEYVMVHAGYAVQTMSEAEALAAWALFDQILSESVEPPIQR